MKLRFPLAALAASLAIALALSLAAPAAQAQAQLLKIAHVDYQRLLSELPDAKGARARLSTWQASRQREIDQEQDVLRKEKEQLDKDAPTLAESAKNQRANELQRKVSLLGQKFERLRGEAAERERKELEPILKRLEEVVARLAERESLSYVFELREVRPLYASPRLDITNEVLSQYARVNGAAPAAASASK